MRAADDQPHPDRGAVVEAILEDVLAVAEPRDLSRHLGARRRLELAHGGLDGGTSLLGHHLLEQPRAGAVGGHHGLQVGHVVLRVAGGELGGCEQLAQALLLEVSGAHQAEGPQQHALFGEPH